MSAIIANYVHGNYSLFVFDNGNYQAQKGNEVVLTGIFTKEELTTLDLGQTVAERLEDLLHAKPTFEVNSANYPIPEYESELSRLINTGHYDIPEEVAKYAYPVSYDLPDFATVPGRRIARRYYHEVGNALESLFKRDVLHTLGITNHPKANKLYSMAWNRGHAAYSDVFSEAQELAELLTI